MEKPFVNRVNELKQLTQALVYDGQESPVLVFTGIGGMGKTALRIAFEKQVLRPNQVPYAILDYDGDPNQNRLFTLLLILHSHLFFLSCSSLQIHIIPDRLSGNKINVTKNTLGLIR